MIGQSGMTEHAAGEALLKYMDQKGLDVDAFDVSGDEPRETAEAPAESSPSSEKASDTPPDGKDAEPEDKADAAGEDPAESSDQQKEEKEADKADAPQQIESAVLASLLGVEEDDLVVSDDGTISLRTKVNGEEGAATARELIKSHQLERNLNSKHEQNVARQRELENEYQERMKALSDAISAAQAVHGSRRQKILNQYNEVDWRRLEQDDPGRAALAQNQFARALQEEDQALQQAQMAVQEQQRQQLEAVKAKSTEALRESMPDLFDSEKGPILQRDMATYLSEQGFVRQEIDGIVDHRVLGVVRDALRYREMVSKIDPVKKRVAELPKVVKPGTTTSQAESREEVRLKALRRVRKTGDEQDMARGLLDSGLIDRL